MKEIINTPGAPPPIGPYNQAVMSGNTLYISGQIALDPKNGKLVEGGVGKETLQVMQNLEAILKEAGMTFEDVVKSTIFIKDMHSFAELNEVYGRFFNPDSAPARETVEVSNLPKFVNVEISMIAVR
jgi:2-iminobutanoate/2-iminopropanoate deaminase